MTYNRNNYFHEIFYFGVHQKRLIKYILNNLGLVRKDYFINYDIVYCVYVGHRRENTEMKYMSSV